jgi:hypothetical protein
VRIRGGGVLSRRGRLSSAMASDDDGACLAAVPMLCLVGTAGNLVTWIISKERASLTLILVRIACSM